MTKMIRTYLSPTPHFPVGLEMDHPICPSLMDIYNLLANGRNVRLTLHKDDGVQITYELVEVDDDDA